MFLENYLDDIYLELVINIYGEEYIDEIDEDNFILVYQLLEDYGFYFIDDIILKYIEIFEMDVIDVKDKLEELKDELGDNFIYTIGNDMTYLGRILD